MISRMGLSPECEQSLLHICGDDPDKLTELTKTARIHGHRFSRYIHSIYVCACTVCVHINDTCTYIHVCKTMYTHVHHVGSTEE